MKITSEQEELSRKQAIEQLRQRGNVLGSMFQMNPALYGVKMKVTGKIGSDGGPSEYYDFPEGCTTLNDLIEYKGMSFAQGNIFKAAYRLGNKEGISLEYDLNKIIYYANRMLKQLETKND